MKKFLILLLILVSTVIFTSCDLNSGEEEEPGKVGLLLTSSPDVPNSTGAYGYEALKYLESKYGVEISYNENISSQESASYLLTRYGNDNYDLVIGIGDMFNEPMLDASGAYQGVEFVCIGGERSEGNVTSYTLSTENLNYLAGFIVGFLTTETTLGYISTHEEDKAIESFIKGAREVNNTFNVDTYILGDDVSYLDVVSNLASKGKVAAGLFINSKDIESALQEAEISFVSVGGPVSTVESGAQVPRIAFDYNEILERAYSDYLLNNLKGENIELGFSDGYIYMDSYEGLSDTTKSKVESLVNSFD